MALLHLDAHRPGPDPRPGAARAHRHADRPGPGRPRPDPDAYAAWLRLRRADYGGWTTVFDTLGFFSIFSSWPFRVLTGAADDEHPGLLGQPGPAALAARDQPAAGDGRVLLRARDAARRGHHRQPPRGRHARTSRRCCGPTTTGCCPARDTGAAHNVYAERFRFGPFGTVIAHLSLVVILIGALLGATFGFSDDGVAVPVGEHRGRARHRPGGGSPVLLEDLYPDGSPKDYVSDLILYKDGQAGPAQGRPSQLADASGRRDLLPVVLRHRSADHRAGRRRAQLLDQGVPLVWSSDDGRHTIGEMVLPEQGTTVMVVVPASGQVDPEIRAGQIQVEVYTEGSEHPGRSRSSTRASPPRSQG